MKGASNQSDIQITENDMLAQKHNDKQVAEEIKTNVTGSLWSLFLDDKAYGHQCMHF